MHGHDCHHLNSLSLIPQRFGSCKTLPGDTTFPRAFSFPRLPATVLNALHRQGASQTVQDIFYSKRTSIIPPNLYFGTRTNSVATTTSFLHRTTTYHLSTITYYPCAPRTPFTTVTYILQLLITAFAFLLTFTLSASNMRPSLVPSAFY